MADEEQADGAHGQRRCSGQENDVGRPHPDPGQLELAGQTRATLGEDLADLVGREVGRGRERRRLLTALTPLELTTAVA